jgi:hypothetical protein
MEAEIDGLLAEKAEIEKWSPVRHQPGAPEPKEPAPLDLASQPLKLPIPKTSAREANMPTYLVAEVETPTGPGSSPMGRWSAPRSRNMAAASWSGAARPN